MRKEWSCATSIFHAHLSEDPHTGTYRQAPVIRVLPAHVANQIAAGEVVERPAAVVKELVENSLDAGARRVEVAFEDGGRRLIVVEDDGCGICPEDLPRAVERHATSKLKSARDLDSLGSFGFRGEALPSIASVSRFTMRSRAEGWDEGTEIQVNGGRVSAPRAVGMPKGTRVEVAHLFEGVPARRKFLKSDRTEAAHIILSCRLLAVAHPGVAFTLRENGREAFASPACKGLAERVGEVFGRELAAGLARLDAAMPGLRLHGLLSRPGPGRATRSELFLYVNSRPVESRQIATALLEACRGFIHKGRFPAAFLFVELDPRAVDVNVHPTKREVRLRDERGVCAFVGDAVLKHMEELAREDGAKFAKVNPPERIEAPAPAIRPQLARPAYADNPRPEPIQQRGSPQPALVPQAPARPSAAQIAPSTPPPRPDAGPAPEPLKPPAQAPVTTAKTTASPRPSAHRADALPARWRYIGTAHGRHVLFETPDGLLCLHRPAALARVLYEDYLQSLESGQLLAQQLLFPHLFELPPLLAALLEKHLDFFRANGFGIESFGGDSFRISSIPAWFEGEHCEEFVKEAVDKISAGGLRPDRDAALARETLARMASLHAANTSGADDEAEVLSLARRLMSCRNPLSDPRGRPTYFELSRSELDKRA